MTSTLNPTIAPPACKKLPETTWVTRKEAAEYLRMNTSTVDSKLVLVNGAHVPFEHGKLRYRLMDDGRVKHSVRILRADVLAMLPLIE